MRRYSPWLPLLLLCAAFSGVTGCGLFVKQIPEGKPTSETPADRFVKIDGIRYHYQAYPGAGKTIFLLHGFGSSTYTWERMIPCLTQAGFSVYALDMKGFGWSDKPKDVAYDPYTLMEEVNRWMETVKLSHVVFVGNSLGGAIAWLMALEHPDKVWRLVLVDAAAYPIRKPFPLNMAQVPLAGPMAKLFFSRSVVRWTLERVYYHDEWVTEAQVTAYFDRLRAGNGLDAQLAIARALDANQFGQYIDRIPSIDKETLIIWGEEDHWIPLDAVGRRLERELPNARLKTIPSCGHVPQEEYPKETARLVIDFVAHVP